MDAIRKLVVLFSVLSISGCASYFTPRPPVIEDKVGLSGQETVGTLATAPDYRIVYVRLSESAKVCAEAPADAAAQFGATFAAALSSQTGKDKPLSAEAKAGLAVAMKQIFKRSQGVQLFRDGAFALCNLYLNGEVPEGAYLEELKELRKTAAKLIELEIPFLEKITIDPITVPTSPTPPDVTKDTSKSNVGTD
jgi:hypothetical protein